MAFHIVEELLNGIIIFKPDVFSDERGFFVEQFRIDYLRNAGIKEDFVQENHSGSIKNVIRGLHFQWDKPMGKLIRVIRGGARFIEVDVRHNSNTVGQYCSFSLSDSNRHIAWVPAGFANGFAALSDRTEVQYLCTELWNPKGEGAIRWNDPALGIDWGVDNPILSPKDAAAQSLNEWLQKEESKLFSV